MGTSWFECCTSAKMATLQTQAMLLSSLYRRLLRWLPCWTWHVQLLVLATEVVSCSRASLYRIAKSRLALLVWVRIRGPFSSYLLGSSDQQLLQKQRLLRLLNLRMRWPRLMLSSGPEHPVSGKQYRRARKIKNVRSKQCLALVEIMLGGSGCCCCCIACEILHL